MGTPSEYKKTEADNPMKSPSNTSQHILPRPTTMTDALVESLRTSILSGDFSPGDHLRQSDLAERYGVSRIPLRDALGRLAGDGLVEFDQHRNARVVQLNVDDVSEIYAIRVALEPMAAERAVEQADDAASQQLIQLSETMDYHAQDLVLGSKCRRDFYDTFYKLSGLERTHATIMRMRDEITLYHRTSLSEATESHGSLRTCISERDATGAFEVVQHHLVMARDDLIDAIITGSERT
jgi:DNA-binding GntR family transcriptional regulator